MVVSTAFKKKITDILLSLYDRKYQDVFIFDDFNLNLLKANDADNCDFVNFIYFFSPVINKPTRVTNISATPIDHIWTTQLEVNIGNYIIATDITDHFSTVSPYKLKNIKPDPKVIQKRLITSAALQLLTDDLVRTNWNNALESECPTITYNLFYNDFYDLFEKHFPIKTLRLTTKSQVSPYITTSLKK